MEPIRKDQVFEKIVKTIREALLVLDSDLKVILANQSFYDSFNVKPEETIGQVIYDLGNKQWDIPKLRELLETILPEKASFDNYEVEHAFDTIGRRTMLLNARQIEQGIGKEQIILLAIEDITARKEIETGLEKTCKELAVIKKSADAAHEFAESFINTVREPLISLDQDLRVVTASRSFYEFFKVNPEETVGQLIYNLGNKQWNIPKLRELLENILPEKTTFDNYEVEHDFATIGRRTMLLNARQIEQAMGKERIILLAIEDITERVQSETLLKNSEEQYRRLFETADDGILLLEKSKLKIRHANPAIMAMLGYSTEELIGNDMKGIGFPDKIGTFQEILQKLDKDGIAHYEDVAIPDKAGQDIYTDIYMADRARLVQCNIRDISERKQAEKSLHASKEKFHSMVDNIGIGVALISPTMEILEINRQLHAWFPDIDPSVRPICYQAFNNPPRDDLCDYCPTCRTLQDGNVHEGTTVMPTPEGPRNYRIISSPIVNEQGSVTAAIEMVEDITERLSLEAQLQQAQKMESIGRLAGGVAHDYNNALSVIIGFTEMAIDGVEPDGPVHDDLEEVLSAAKRATDITRQLLAFARKQIIAPKVLDLNDNVANLLKMLRRLIGEDIDLAWLPGASLCSVKMDPTQIDQILTNLCVNARDAIEDVGKITIKTGIKVFDADYCANHAGYIPGEFVMLAVSDSGCGIHKETLVNIFDPFFTTKDVDKGTGLGLATVHGIVKQNNGFINVYSEPDNGTAFEIYFPRHEGKGVEILEEITKENPRGLGETILLVEDDASILKLAKKILDGLGYNVLTADTPTEAIRMAEKHVSEINLLITDVIMPGMNGRDLAERLKPLYPDLKCMFMSGYTTNVIAHHGVLDEGVYFIQKPFARIDLATTVRKVLDE